MLNKITNIVTITIKNNDALDELASYLTEHIDNYYKFKEIHNTARFYIGNKGHVFRITAEADIITPRLASSNLFDSRPVDEREFSKWEIQLEELIYNLNLEPNFITYGIIPTYSYKFTMKQVKQFVYYMSLKEEDYYA